MARLHVGPNCREPLAKEMFPIVGYLNAKSASEIGCVNDPLRGENPLG
jgi:hypothetical protein